MKKFALRRVGVAAVATAGIFGLAACGGVTDPNAGAGDTSGEETVVEASLVSPIPGATCDEGAELTGDPIVVGASQSLTGALAPTGMVHDEVAKIVVDWVNLCGGINGSPVEYTALDDQSTPAQAATNYERLIADGADFVVGPYGTASILAGAGPVGAAGYAYPTATNGSPNQLIGDFHFPSWQIGGGAEDVAGVWDPTAEDLLAALNAGPNAPETMFIATSKFPSTLASAQAAQRVFSENGVDVVDMVEYELGTTDFNAIATRIAQADPDFVYIGALGADPTNFFLAFDALAYTPKQVFFLLPSPAAINGLGAQAEGVLVSSIFEDNAPLNESDIAKYFIAAYGEAAAAHNLFPGVETQAAAGFGAWQILLKGIYEAGADNAAVIDWLNNNEVETLAGSLRFDGFNGYTTDFNRVTQIQDGKRVMVWPEDIAGGKIR